MTPSLHPALLRTPVAFIIFNRPDKTRIVFEEIRKARPAKLFIIADGPRNEEERARCEATRAVVEDIDWECELYTKFEEKNLGVKYAPPAGISWVFEHVESAIILEDDCLPHPDFFPFCEELLERYKDDDRVMHISGDNYRVGNSFPLSPYSYHFSAIPALWGWATWKRAWKKYDQSMTQWPETRDKKLLRHSLPNLAVVDRFEYVFERYYTNKIKSWDGPWLYACLANQGLCINPNLNLISNIGVGIDSAHEVSSLDWKANLPTHSLTWPLIHPPILHVDKEADEYLYRYVFNINRYLTQQLRWFFKSHFTGLYFFIRKQYRKFHTG